MSNLIEKYGPDWFNNKFNGSYFRYNGIPARVVEARGGRRSGEGVVAVLAPRIGGKVKSVQRVLPASFFKDSSRFNVPELGYRHTNGGKCLLFMRRENTSYVRGLSSRNILLYESKLTTFLRNQGVDVGTLSADQVLNLALDPTFIPLQRGIKLMLEGKLLSFAASPTLAVVPKEEGEGLDILMCDKTIGSVLPDGTMDITFQIAKTYVEESLCK